MSGRLVVRRYALALYEAAKETGQLGEVREDMDFIQNLMDEAPEIRKFCLESEGKGTKEAIFVETAFAPYVGPGTGRALNLLRENGRLAAIPFLPEAFLDAEDRDLGRFSLLIESAFPLARETADAIAIKMKDRTGRDCRRNFTVVPGLIRGFRISWENRMIDLSLRGRFKKMKRLLKESL